MPEVKFMYAFQYKGFRHMEKVPQKGQEKHLPLYKWMVKEFNDPDEYIKVDRARVSVWDEEEKKKINFTSSKLFVKAMNSNDDFIWAVIEPGDVYYLDGPKQKPRLLKSGEYAMNYGEVKDEVQN